MSEGELVAVGEGQPKFSRRDAQFAANTIEGLVRSITSGTFLVSDLGAEEVPRLICMLEYYMQNGRNEFEHLVRDLKTRGAQCLEKPFVGGGEAKSDLELLESINVGSSGKLDDSDLQAIWNKINQSEE